MLFKIYTRLPWRIFNADMVRAFDMGYISTIPHRNSIAAYMCQPELTSILMNLITVTSAEFRLVETDFAVDSSGFGAGRVSWREIKDKPKKQRRDWMKAHIIYGIQSHIVTTVNVTSSDVHDSPMLPFLLKQMTKHFKVRLVCADKGYASAQNLEAIEAIGAEPYIVFKDNATGETGGATWQRVFLSYQENQAEYDWNCRKRNAAETTFSTVKRRFGERVRSKDKVAIKNEVLGKFLCHNLCVLIKKMSEEGVEPTFRE
jgi:transposase